MRSSYLWLIDPSCVVPTLALQDPSFVSSRPAELGGSQQDGWEEAAPAQAPFPSVAPAQASCPHPHLISSFPHSPLLSFSSPPPPPHPPHPPTRPLGLSPAFLSLWLSGALSFLLPPQLSDHPVSHPSPPGWLAHLPPGLCPLLPPPPPSVLAPGYSPPRGEGSWLLMSSLLWGQPYNPPYAQLPPSIPLNPGLCRYPSPLPRRPSVGPAPYTLSLKVTASHPFFIIIITI